MRYKKSSGDKTRSKVVRSKRDKQWLVSQKKSAGGDTREEIEKLGFKIIGKSKDKNGLFYVVNPPVGWTKFRKYQLTFFRDERGKLRFTQLYDEVLFGRKKPLTFVTFYP